MGNQQPPRDDVAIPCVHDNIDFLIEKITIYDLKVHAFLLGFEPPAHSGLATYYDFNARRASVPRCWWPFRASGISPQEAP